MNNLVVGFISFTSGITLSLALLVVKKLFFSKKKVVKEKVRVKESDFDINLDQPFSVVENYQGKMIPVLKEEKKKPEQYGFVQELREPSPLNNEGLRNQKRTGEPEIIALVNGEAVKLKLNDVKLFGKRTFVEK